MINYNRTVFVEPTSAAVNTRDEALAAWNMLKTFRVYQGNYSTFMTKEMLSAACNRICLQYATGVVEVHA